MLADDILEGIDTEKAETIKSAVEQLVEAEKRRGIEATKKKSKDVESLIGKNNRFKDALRKLEIDPDADDLDNRLESFLSTKTTATQKPNDSELEIKFKNLQKNFESITQRLTESEAQKQASEAKLVRTKLTSELVNAFGDEVPSKKYVIATLLNEGTVKIDDDGETPVWVVDGETVDFKAGLEAWKKSNPDLVITKQHSGAGTHGTQAKGKKTMTGAEYTALVIKDPKTAQHLMSQGYTISG